MKCFTQSERKLEKDFLKCFLFKKVVNTTEQTKMREMVDCYNNERLHSSLHYLRPIDFYCGGPIKSFEIRKQKMAYARERRNQINMGPKQIRFYNEIKGGRT